MMQQALEQKIQDAERFQREEGERVRAEQEAERLKLEEEERKKKEEEMRLKSVIDQIKSQQKIIDKKKYQGGKVEQISEYYILLMRKKEQQITTKLQQKKFNTSAALSRIESLAVDLEGAQVTVSKEQQLKLLTDILGKIETLESKVRSQLTKQRQAMGLGPMNLGGHSQSRMDNFDTNSAYRGSTHSFLTSKRRGFY